MAVTKPIIYEIAPDTYAINEFGMAAMYLLIGSERALLIDTGCGVCNLKEIVESLTDKPYIVAATHGHGDHVGGMCAFESIYINEKDWDMAKQQTDRESLCAFADSFYNAGCGQVYEYTTENIPDYSTLPEFLPLNEGDTFELGDRLIETYEIAGHTPGGVAFLDGKNRIIFSGDSCNFNLLTPYCCVETTLKNMRKFQSLSPRFDQNFNGHAGYLGNPSCFSQTKSVPSDLIHICEAILRGEGTAEPWEFVGHKLTMMKYGNAKLSYDPNLLWEK